MNYRIIAVILLLLVMTASCMPGDGSRPSDEPAGTISAIWHGWIAPFSLIRGLFNSSISIYESNNIGWWYDFGFYIAVISGFGGLSLTRKKRDKKRPNCD